MLVFGTDGPIATEPLPGRACPTQDLDLIGDLALTGRRIKAGSLRPDRGMNSIGVWQLSLVHDLPVDQSFREVALDIRSIQRPPAPLPHAVGGPGS